ncbi:MAG: hypothetical protein M1819_004465 [Sarea resinae]|nr:MAG: hypothetical protein M1819_004465 [Sarea resinae]
MSFGGVALKVGQTTLRCIQFLASILILGIFSYFLAALHDHNAPIARWIKATEGLSGAAALYGIFAMLLTCFLGGLAFFAFLGIVLDVCFVGAFVAIAVMTRKGTDSCHGYVDTPLGYGPNPGKGALFHNHGNVYINNWHPNYKLTCRLEKAVFAVAIINIVLFIVSALLQLALARHHQKEKRFGPSPANNYTSGTGRRTFWRTKRGPKPANEAYGTNDAELGTIGSGTTGLTAGAGVLAGEKQSSDTRYTGSTVAGPDSGYGNGTNKYAQDPAIPQHNGYYTTPAPTYETNPAYNPYGDTKTGNF